MVSFISVDSHSDQPFLFCVQAYETELLTQQESLPPTGIFYSPIAGLTSVSAFTRYFSTLKLYYGSLYSLCCPPPICNAYPFSILLHDLCTIYAPPPTPPLYAIHHSLLGMAILCKGQPRVNPGLTQASQPATTVGNNMSLRQLSSKRLEDNWHGDLLSLVFLCRGLRDGAAHPAGTPPPPHRYLFFSLIF